MKKILFNDRFGLTAAVINGSKTQTRRMATLDDYDRECIGTPAWNIRKMSIITNGAKYRRDEVVAVAQPYSRITSGADLSLLANTPGWKNKMYVKAEAMPHRIRITNVRLERLQDISDRDCIREGILEDCPGVQYSFPTDVGFCNQYPFNTPRDAYAALVDKVCGRGTWRQNPWMFVYEFCLED